ncbi:MULTISPECIES: fumarylacetoacetate hydrolase family protein [unclassified Beijerinckia]|uniref:2-keto-4-pentenoate hydratase n=1 Tax=unclassified Beijerinckia TaxID=2638183 RepID=UPI00089CDE99|nr:MULTISPECIES: fumarylacetoacetate hydrolase family protein [unclassified Beijerinckia]MDH7799037.1 2-keto-4-pentenoate hydratase [Beijerinckia sp. GAS462]SED97094.1 2-keto-4-pentenoate hydratase [Beijerinckia sp. 28-YEA-48]
MNIREDSIRAAAEALYVSRQTRTPIGRISETFGIAGIENAYRVQRANTDRYLKEGRRLSGRKIGLTSKAVQAQIGVDHPDFGMLWDDLSYSDGDTLPLSQFIQPKAEIEIAFVVGKPIDDPCLRLTDLISAMEYALPAVEIVDSAIAHWALTLVDTIADNASGGGYILGTSPRKIGEVDLRLGGAVLSVNGAIASTGAGAACLGHPLQAALWLARKMIEIGHPLAAGDLILSGALAPMVTATPDDVFTAEIQGFSTFSFAFGEKVS